MPYEPITNPGASVEIDLKHDKNLEAFAKLCAQTSKELQEEQEQKRVMMVKYIQHNVSMQSIWALVAEEAMEMAHAAMKISRTYSIDNPTNILREDAHDNFIQELFDFYTALHVAGEGFAPKDCKLERWFNRLVEQDIKRREGWMTKEPRTSGEPTEPEEDEE